MFSQEWTIIKLSDIVERVKRRNKDNISNLPLTISAQFGLIAQTAFFDRQIASKDMSNYYLLLNGEFAYNKSYSNDYPWGAVKRLDQYDMGVLSSLYFCFVPFQNKVNSDYLVHYFETTKWHKGISDIAGEGARNHGLLNMSVEDYFATEHFIPSIKEQGKIALFLNLITQRIETQSKIIEEQKTLKKQIINTIFANSSWQPIRVSDIGTLGRGRVISTSEINNSKAPIYPVYSSQTSNNGIMGYLDKYEFDGEYITWTTDGANAGTVFYRNGKFNCTNVCGTIKLKPNYDAYFITYALQLAAKKYVSTNLANPKLMNNVMAEIIIHCPAIEKQKQIGAFLRLVDEKIAIEEKILNGYKKIKTYLLSNLFV